MIMDPYKVLGLPPSASKEEVKKRFRQLALEVHPDRNPGNKGAELKFIEIKEAYEKLMNSPEPGQPRSGIGGFNSFKRNSSFGFSFGFSEATGPQPAPPPPHGTQAGEKITIAMQISPFDILLNKTIEVKYKRRVPCVDCSGRGSDLETCSECQGKGFVSQVIEAGYQKIAKNSPCHTCMGRGYEKKNSCDSCRGTGLVLRDDVQKIRMGKVERGFIFVPGKGHHGPRQGPAGALVIEVHVWYPGQKAIPDEAREYLEKANELILEKGEWRTP